MWGIAILTAGLAAITTWQAWPALTCEAFALWPAVAALCWLAWLDASGGKTKEAS